MTALGGRTGAVDVAGAGGREAAGRGGAETGDFAVGRRGVLPGVPHIYDGAEGGNRTHMTSRPLDFESSASTNFTTSANVFQMIQMYICLVLESNLT